MPVYQRTALINSLAMTETKETFFFSRFTVGTLIAFGHVIRFFVKYFKQLHYGYEAYTISNFSFSR
jgi:hypothetical protein